MLMMPYLYDPFDPMGTFSSSVLPEGASEKELEAYQRLLVRMLFRSIVVFLACIAFMALCSLFAGCTTQRVTERETTDHRISEMIDRMDSVIARRTVIQHDSAWRQEILRQFQSIRESSDTSRTLVVDTAGRVVKETLIINNVRETTSETEHEQLTVISRRLEVMDSTISLMQKQIQHSDLLLQQREQTVDVPVEKQLSWFQQMRLWLGNLVLVALAVVAAWWFVRKKTWWLALLRKMI